MEWLLMSLQTPEEEPGDGPDKSRVLMEIAQTYFLVRNYAPTYNSKKKYVHHDDTILVSFSLSSTDFSMS